MPTHSLLPFVDSPDGLAQDLLISNNASIPGPYSGMTPHTTFSETAVLQSAGSTLLSCMFCDQTFAHQDELGPHVLTQHQTSSSDPAVLHVKAEFRVPEERPRAKVSSHPEENEEIHSCIVCGQVSQDAAELESHMRKHKDYFTYCCNVCGRRFREPWFLKNHMRMHGKSGSRSKTQQDPETPATVNGIVQDPAPEPVATLYKMCMVCGFFFPDHDRLVQHSKVHNREVEPAKDEDKENTDGTTDSVAKQETFLQCLGLLPRSAGNRMQHERSSKWIPELDPFKTYQAWQLATKGKIAVGPNTTKDIGQEASTDNEECGSDKEESSNIWSGGQGDKATKEILGRDARSQQQTAAENPRPQRRSLMQKHQDKERPTTCEECQRTFRTYHQLVLHSRVHKRDRGGEESPTSSEGKLSRAGSVEHAEEGAEEGLDEAALTGEDGSKVRSKECSYCGKSFRSSYYLTIHLRTHTGEKPYKCPYCDYAAAQKTSLKYHLERRHKDKASVYIPSRPVPSEASPTDEKYRNGDESQTPTVAKLWVPGVSVNVAPEDAVEGKLDNPLVQMNAEDVKTVIKSVHSPTDAVVKCPVPVHLKTEKKEIKDENSEEPLNLSLKVSLSISAKAQPRNALIPSACSVCAFETMYPEVLTIHKKLLHNIKADVEKKDLFRGNLKPKRLTGCPPALNGVDVAPISMNAPSLPRRTKSPTPPEEKPQEETPVSKPQAPTARSPPRTSPPRTSPPHTSPPQGGAARETQQQQQQRVNVITHPGQEPSSRQIGTALRFVPNRPAPPVRVGVGEKTQAVRNGAFWHSEAARFCLSSRFGSFPQMDFGESSSKRFKYSAPAASEAGEGPNRTLIPVRGSKTPSPGSAQATVTGNFSASRAGATAMGTGLEAEWGMMNFLTSYMPAEMASFYHGIPVNPSHAGLPTARAGSRSVPYHHLPSLLNLQRRDASSLFPNQRYGTTDKNT